MTADEILIEGVARGTERLLSSDAFMDKLADRVAAVIAKRFEPLTSEQAAGILRVTPETLAANHVEWGLDKSVALGKKLPRYFLSQVFERLTKKVVQGKREKKVHQLEGSNAA